MKNTHDLILDYLQTNLCASAADLSQALHLTRADIRYHLNLLLAQNIIEKIAFRNPVKKGRPTQLFHLALKSQQNNLAFLADALLSTLYGSIDEIINPLVQRFVAAIPSAKLRTTQLNRLVAFLNEHGYQSRWEAYVIGPRILFRNCPYAAILAKHPELCSMDTEIISSYLMVPFRQTARIDLENAKIPACIFLINSQRG
jgi:predicted ArsR family transcriptional regulator